MEERFPLPHSDRAFSPEVMDHFLHPRNVGKVGKPTLAVEIVNEVCGDKMALTLRLDSGRVAEARFQSLGCAVAIAAASMLTESISGQPIDRAAELAESAFAKVDAGVFDEKLHCRQMVRKLWAMALEQLTARESDL